MNPIIKKDLKTFEKQLKDLISDAEKDDVLPERSSFYFSQLLSFDKLATLKFDSKLSLPITKALIKGKLNLIQMRKVLFKIQKITQN